MATLDFSLKVISPAFVAGSMFTADNVKGKRIERLVNKDDSLRIPSLRGVLRFWFRAMHGNLSTDLEELHKAEAKIFGDTNYGQGIKIIMAGQENVECGEVSVSQTSDIGYLGYGPLLFQKDDDGSKRFTSHHANPKSKRRDAVMPGAVFRFHAIGDDDQITALRKCLILLHLFGGIGSRSRRGWGSLAVTRPKDLMPAWENDPQKWIKKALNTIWENGSDSLKRIPMPAFSAFSSLTSIAISKDSWNNKNRSPYQEILQKIAKAMLDLRNYQRGSIGISDHAKEDKDFASKSLQHVPQRLAFGMPYKVQSQKRLMGIEYLIKFPKNSGNRNEDRRASPLILKILETPDNQLYAVALFLKASFFGDPGAELVAKYRSQLANRQTGQKETWKDMSGTQKMTDWSAIDDFLKASMWGAKLTF